MSDFVAGERHEQQSIGIQTNLREDSPQSLENRFCKRCGIDQPISSFRPQKWLASGKAHRSHTCNRCHARQEKYRKRKINDRRQKGLLPSAWSELCNAERRRQNIEKLVLKLIASFGGTQGLAKAWIAAFNEATACKRLRGIQAALVIMQWLAREEPKLSAASDTQLALSLDQELQSVLRDTFANQIDTIRKIACEFGFELKAVESLTPTISL